ncbi:M1 family metallopeptidase [soil metagenome]
MNHLLGILVLTFLIASCTNYSKLTEEVSNNLNYRDLHSYAQPGAAVVRHLDWNAEVNFDSKAIKGIASLTIEKSEGADEIILDSKGLIIEKVSLDNGLPATYTISEEDKILGSSIVIKLNQESTNVIIHYQTGADAEALQWLEPIQTAGKVNPFLFTQSQAILARSWLPIQDSPGIRFTYNAIVKVPGNLLALMSAENPQEKNEEGIYNFKMEQPIPAYLMALAVGDITFRPVGKQTGVYAEPEIIEAAAHEFAEMDDMLQAAEKLYGQYRWSRYDLLVLPPSFPFGGMENPRLTFATPTILAGDRSLTSLVAHELAHSWSGNLVTNATWNDFWLNEGFTVYFERRIMEELNGASYAEMLVALGYQDLKETVNDLIASGKEHDTQLKLNLEDRDPDEGVSDVAYEKGYFFLRQIEYKVGRTAFDNFIQDYFNQFAFKSINTENFILFLKDYFNKNNRKIDTNFIDNWIYNPGIPSELGEIKSERFQTVGTELQRFLQGIPAQDINAEDWSSHEWLHFIRHLPTDISFSLMNDLDKTYNFSGSGNAEILAAWLHHVIARKYKPGYSSLKNFLTTVGRRKFLVPLYRELIKTPEGKSMAMDIYKIARPNYHFVSVNTLDELLDWK